MNNECRNTKNREAVLFIVLQNFSTAADKFGEKFAKSDRLHAADNQHSAIFGADFRSFTSTFLKPLWKLGKIWKFSGSLRGRVVAARLPSHNWYPVSSTRCRNAREASQTSYEGWFFAGGGSVVVGGWLRCLGVCDLSSRRRLCGCVSCFRLFEFRMFNLFPYKIWFWISCLSRLNLFLAITWLLNYLSDLRFVTELTPHYFYRGNLFFLIHNRFELRHNLNIFTPQYE